MNGKKNQTTLFAIISIILVIVAVILFSKADFNFFESSQSKIEDQIKEVVEDCIFDSTKQGIFLIGFQGGRIEKPDVTTLFSEQYTDLGLPIRNWDTQREDVPSISQMQTSLKEFSTQTSFSCIKSNLKTLEDLADINISDNLVLDVSINNEDVRVQANLPISFNMKNNVEKKYSVNNFVVQLKSLRLKELYELAIQIYNEEAQSNFMEELVLDQIYSDSDYSSSLSMPSEGMSFTCAKKIWTYPQLKENLARLNNNNFKYLYFQGTKSIDSRFDLNLVGNDKIYKDYYKKQYVIDIEDKKSIYKNFDVEVFMPSTEITGRSGILQKYPYREFEVTPSNGNIVKSMDFKVDGGFTKIPVPCIQIFHHLYTLDYDLMVKITDKNEDAQDYFFQFPLRVLIKNNNPKVKTVSPIQDEPLTANNDAFCSDKNRLYPMIVFVKDEVNGAYLSDVNITYKCINLLCDVGSTAKPRYKFNPKIERINAQPYFEGKFPYCIQGQIIAKKAGYHKAEIRVNTDESLLNRQATYSPNDIELTPLKEFKVDISTFLLINRETGKGQRVRDESDGSIYVSIENKGNDFSSQVIWPTKKGIYDTLSFLDKEETAYNVSILYADADNKLKGIVEYENWIPDIHKGNLIRINIPTSNTEIDEKSYQEFLDYVEALKLSNSNKLIDFR